MTQPKPGFVRQLRRRLKPVYTSGRHLVARTLFAYGADELTRAIRALSIESGDTLLVHSRFPRGGGFQGTPSDVIDCLLSVLGERGNLLMMSIPYRGSSQQYVEGDPLFDVRRTPSAVGVISEVFRRRDDVVRSLSPLHPVLAHGPLAAWLVADHDKSPFSCGKGTPFDRFLRLDGKFLFLDAPYSSLTFMHFVEDTFRPELPVPLYDAQPASVRVKDELGRESRVRQWFFSHEARARRNFVTIERALELDGSLLATRVGNTRLLSVRARAVVDCAARLVAEGPGFYK
jgi:aminoglycoside 3-N-acetyltransferase